MVLWSCLGTIHVACARAKHRRMRRRFAHHDGSQRRPGGRERANDASLVLRDDVASTPYPLMGSDRVGLLRAACEISRAKAAAESQS